MTERRVPRIDIVRGGGRPDDPVVVRAIALALAALEPSEAAASDQAAWWRAGTVTAITGRAVRSPSELGPRGS